MAVADLRPKISSIPCSFSQNLAKSYVGAPPPEGWHPLLREILDPPLHGASELGCYHQVLVRSNGLSTGNFGFLNYAMYCTHHTVTGTVTGNHCFLLCPSQSRSGSLSLSQFRAVCMSHYSMLLGAQKQDNNLVCVCKPLFQFRWGGGVGVG